MNDQTQKLREAHYKECIEKLFPKYPPHYAAESMERYYCDLIKFYVKKLAKLREIPENKKKKQQREARSNLETLEYSIKIFSRQLMVQRELIKILSAESKSFAKIIEENNHYYEEKARKFLNEHDVTENAPKNSIKVAPKELVKKVADFLKTGKGLDKLVEEKTEQLKKAKEESIDIFFKLFYQQNSEVFQGEKTDTTPSRVVKTIIIYDNEEIREKVSLLINFNLGLSAICEVSEYTN